MAQNIPDFSSARILVIGDIMLDRYWNGATSRISPEAPVPIIKVGETEDRLGGAANVAKNLSTLGCQTSLFGIIGNDSAGEIIKDLLNQSNIKHDLHIDEHHPTITKLRVISQHQQLIRLDFEEKLDEVNKHILLAELETNICDFDAVIISDYAKGTISCANEIISLCRTNKIPIVVDPKGTDFEAYRDATVITPNRTELEIVIGKCSNTDELARKAESLRAKLNLNAILITLGEDGMALIEESGCSLIPTEARDVFDVTGAGDTVAASLTAAMACKNKLKDAMRLANQAAGIVVGKLGTATVSSKELINALPNKKRKSPLNIKTLDELTDLVESARNDGEKIVFTNGCFDIIHAGHTRYLQQAAELGDRLIVAVNSDASVEKLKGPGRPINNLQNRMDVLSSLACVDWVIPFEEETPLNLIKKIRPDFLTKGGDYTATDIVGYETVTSNNGQVIVMPYHQSLSTSSILERMEN